MDLVGGDEIESFRMEMEEIGRSIRSSFHSKRSFFDGSMRSHADDDEYALQWAAIERLPTVDRLRSSLFYHPDMEKEKGDNKQRQVVDITKLEARDRHMFIENLIKHIENDNLRLPQKQKERMDRVDVKQPTIEVRYKNLFVEANCKVVEGKPLPTLWNATKSFFSVIWKITSFKSQEAKISIIKDISGIIRPSRKVFNLSILFEADA